MLAAAPESAIRYAVMVCTVVTTVCGTWLAYGEPPNLIMKANLYPQLGNAFFLNVLRSRGRSLPTVGCPPASQEAAQPARLLDLLDVIEANAQDVRFLQATRHGEVQTPVEFVEDRATQLGGHAAGVLQWLRNGESFGLALFREKVPEETRKNCWAILSAKNLPTLSTCTITSHSRVTRKARCRRKRNP